jgi:hypothetical protein
MVLCGSLRGQRRESGTDALVPVQFGDVRVLRTMLKQPNGDYTMTDGTVMDGSSTSTSKVTINDKFYGG